MKKIVLLLAIGFIMHSCGNSPDKSKDLNNPSDLNSGLNSGINQESVPSINDADNISNKSSNSELNDLFNMGKNMVEGSKRNGEVDFQLDPEMLIDMLVESGVSRESLEKLINNPDSLKVLAQQAMKERLEARDNEEPVLKGKLTKEQLASKKTPTGVSLEEAILIVQAESGPEATMAKLKTIDSLAGTNMMSQLDLTEAGYVMGDVERKNEVKSSDEEEQKMKELQDKSRQMHSEKESRELLAELEATDQAIASGTLKASPKYQRAIAYRKKTVTYFHKDIVRKSEAAKRKFKALNPDLFYGDDVGVSYVGNLNKTVYLPLGPLSFADEVVHVNHPQLLTQEVNNVLGEPDVIESFDDATGIYSLGLAGTLTIRFTDNALVDVNGPDLYLFEIGQLEPTELEISKDGKSWIKIGKIDGGVAEVDIAPYVKPNDLFYYVRFKDLKEKSGIPGADVDAIAAIGSAMRLNLDSQVLFDTGKSELKPAGINALKELVNSITVLKKGKVIVEGHTDDVGSDATNKTLSLARAKSVSKALRQLIPSTEFKWQEKGYGESKPIVENDSDENRSKNRRVEILVVPN
ncbi:OmpA family protein [Winogradskyella sp. F6397]|uniref:OmpA family protein n=1 Tax=Winogradskyella marina TaxID=2785530 RepID=A0ABS0EKB9_9FLAO|nr:OmpA family protein [Winogradskyella marina]MBF8150868.1 OmpA family protein [Winogradskyella marina]